MEWVLPWVREGADKVFRSCRIDDARVRLERDSDGNVIRYEMFHGQSPGKPGGVTKNHYWNWPEAFTRGGKSYPVLGFWDQRLAGIATLVPKESVNL